MRRALGYSPLAVLLVFLYLPLLVVVVMSFNDGKNPFVWSGFSTRWYPELLADEAIMAGLRTTIVVAIGATIVAVVLGTTLALALERYVRSRALDTLVLVPAVMPEIVTAVGLLVFYSLVGITLGVHSVLLAHAVFGVAFVAVVVRARLAVLDRSLEEASRDLGAGAWRTFSKVTFPSIRTAMLTGGLLAFTLSIDEFTIAFFTSAPAQPTLPVVVYSMVRFGVTPQVNALATLLLLVSFITVIAAQRWSRFSDTMAAKA